jgi:Fic family protein
MIGISIDRLKHSRHHLQPTLQIMSFELKTKLQTVDAEKAKLDGQRPLPPNTVASLREKLMLEWTYHSNAIEGNTLTLREIKVVLEGSLSEAGHFMNTWRLPITATPFFMSKK